MLCIGSFVNLFSAGPNPATTNKGDSSSFVFPELVPAGQNHVAGNLDSDSPELSSSIQYDFGDLIRQDRELSFSGLRKDFKPQWNLPANAANQQSSFPVGFSGRSSFVGRDFFDRQGSLISRHVRLQI